MARNDIDIQFALRLPPELHRRLKERAEKNRRSLNAEIVTILERLIEAQETIIMPDDLDDTEAKRAAQ